MRSNPTYGTSANVPECMRAFIDNPHFIGNDRILRMEFEVSLNAYRVLQPAYTCPICRARVTMAPVEALSLKELVSTVGVILGEDLPLALLEEKLDGVWDELFQRSLFIRADNLGVRNTTLIRIPLTVFNVF